MIAALNNFPTLLLGGIMLVLLCGIGGAVMLWEFDHAPQIKTTQRARTYTIVEREKDLAAGLGWPWRRWVMYRASWVVAGLIAGIWSNVELLYVVGPAAGFVASRFVLAGRAASRRLKMERAFLARLRDLRDRMSVSNQSLDTALQEIGRNPGKQLEYVLAPWARGGSVVDNIVEAGRRSRSPVVEYACGVLLWARSRSLDSLIEAIDDILLPVGEAQLAVEEESLVTLSQQRAVTFAMSGLMLFMFFVIVRVDVFRSFYQSAFGTVILMVVIGIFAILVWSLGVIIRIGSWTRWNLKALAQEQDRLGV